MIYTNLKSYEQDKHGMFESSLMLATDVGNLFDVVVRDEHQKEIAVDNGVPVCVGDYTGNGLEERYATIAKATDAIAVIGTPAEVKTAFKRTGTALSFHKSGWRTCKGLYGSGA